MQIVQNRLKVSRMFKKHAGFTLAEVLITLAIIGIVAALTIPTIVKNVQQNQLETAFKKVFTNLQQAYNQDCNDRDGVAPDFRKAEDKLEFFDYFKTASSTLPGGSYSAYPYDKSIEGYNYYSQSMYYANPYFRTLSDGSYMAFVGPYVQGVIQVDTNGSKAPNRLGYDVFLFASSTKIIYTADDWRDIPSTMDLLFGPKNTVLGVAASYLENQHLAQVVNPFNCSPISKGGSSDRDSSGMTCTYFAVQNQCPWDASKTYWQTLP